MNGYIKLTLVGAILFILVAVSCYFWYQWETQPYREEYVKTQQFASEYRASQQTEKSVERVDDVAGQVVDTVEQQSVTTQKSTNKTALNKLDIIPKQLMQASQTTEVAVSRFGFGPYPKTPEGWSPIPWDLFQDPAFELMTRVRIKFLEQGVPIVGVTMDKGKVYPIIEGVVYVRWKEVDTPFGTVKQITRQVSNIVDGERLDAIQAANGGVLTVSDVPADIKLIPYDEGGVDPYTFLNLQ